MGGDKSHHHEPIAIVGMSCRYPKANNLEDFWELLVKGEDATYTIPPDRWNQQDCPYPLSDSCKSMNAGFLSVPVDTFDAQFFGISPKEATFMDPQTRLLLELVWEGLEDAGVNPHTLKGEHGGVFVGSWLSDYKDILLQCPGYEEFYRRYMGNSIGSCAARISFLLGMTGPSIATESGCSAAMVAVHMACKSLEMGECEMALACGVNLLLKPFCKDELPVMLSPDGHCKTFDEKADGFARAEGVGVLVLKRLSDAVKDGDRVWALIKGSALTQEGLSKSMGTPTVHSEALAMHLALQDAGVEPAQISYLETHGTGTKVGDPMEVKAIQKSYKSLDRKQPLMLGSVKTNVGHTEACSGITGIMKVVIAMHHGIIPPHRNFNKLNPAIDLDSIPAKIPLEPLNWDRENGFPRMAGVSSFGITGTDAHVILEERPERKCIENERGNMERSIHIATFSAKSKEALDELLRKYQVHCSLTPDSLADIAYTTNVGRAFFAHRAVVAVKTKEELVTAIKEGKVSRNDSNHDHLNSEEPVTPKKICFLFTGQGSQYPGMGKQLYETNPVFRQHFDFCSDLLQNNYNVDIKCALWGTDSTLISKTMYSQTGIFCVEYALLKLWNSWGVRPDYVLGHSLGEFAADVAAGILKVEDAIKLVAERSRLIDALPEGKMLAVRAGKDTVAKSMASAGTTLDFAAFNSPLQTVVAGDADQVVKLADYLKGTIGQDSCTLLKSSRAFHSTHMSPMLKEYQEMAASVERQTEPPNCGFISGVRGKLIHPTELDDTYWVDHTREPVLFTDAIKVALELCGCHTFVEIGPHPVLSALGAANMPGTSDQISWLPSLRRNQDDWSVLLRSLSQLYLKGIPIDWNGFVLGYSRRKVRLPHYPFMGKRFWPEVTSKPKYYDAAAFSVYQHPLLGGEYINPEATILFRNFLNIQNDHTLQFIQDHKIGEQVIFPGACYLEMCISAVARTGNRTASHVKVQNLMIQAPLGLPTHQQEVLPIELQTIVKNESTTADFVEYTVKFVRRVRDTDADDDKTQSSCQWITHATANITVDLMSSTHAPPPEHYSIEQLRKGVEPLSGKLHYQRSAAAGLNFGDSFQTVEKHWMSNSQDGFNRSLLVKIKVPTSKDQPFVAIHPIVMDAMVQAVYIFLNTDTNPSSRSPGLTVPIKIEEFTWPSTGSIPELVDGAFVHVFPSEENGGSKITAHLLDSSGNVMATMSGVQFVETTARAIQAVVDEQERKGEMPDMWEETWKPNRISSLEHRLDLKTAAEFWNQENCTSRLELIPCDDILELDQNLVDMIYFNVVQTMYQLGWEPEVSQIIELDNLLQGLAISQEYKNYFVFMLELLQERGILCKAHNNKLWKINKLPPTKTEIFSTLASKKFTSELVAQFNSIVLMTNVGRNLAAILKGVESPLSYLFPAAAADDDTKMAGVNSFYDDYTAVYGAKLLTGNYILESLSFYKERMGNARFILRILEVGAGTGSYSALVLKALETLGMEYEYTYTDITPSFFGAAEKRFESQLENMKFKVLNIEEDPLVQGFIPNHYDICFAFLVIHATRHIGESLNNLRMLIRPGGMLDMWETTRMDVHLLTFLFGLLPGYWRFEDKELRQKSCLLDTQKWEKVLNQQGFQVSKIFPSHLSTDSLICSRLCDSIPDTISNAPSSTNSHHQRTWIIYENGVLSNYLKMKLKSFGRHVITVTYAGTTADEDIMDIVTIRPEQSEGDTKFMLQQIGKHGNVHIEGILYCWSIGQDTTLNQATVLQPFFHLTKNISMLKSTSNHPIRVGVVTKGLAPFEGNDLSSYHSSTLWGYCRSLMNEMGDIVDCRYIDLSNGANLLGVDKQVQQILCTLFGDNQTEHHVAYLGKVQLSPKLLQCANTSKISQELPLPANSDRFQLILPSTRRIQDLQFGTMEQQSPILLPNDIEIRVKCVALNFRDILAVLKPIKSLENVNAVGLDIVGQVVRIGKGVSRWKLGDFVSGLNMQNNEAALPSHVTLQQNAVIGVPSGMTLCEAVTLPAVFATAYKCLIDEAQLKETDTVLIHTASGGVGLVAIAICKSIVPLANIIVTAGTTRKRNFLKNLGIKHIFNSRNTDYYREINKLTNRRGVDVVLNSLTSAGFKEATLNCCAANARFIEMSKMNVWTEEEVKRMRQDVDYRIVDLSSSEETELCRLMGKLGECIEKDMVKPLPYVRFDAVRIRQAMEYFQKSKHVGKIVVAMPEKIIEANGKLQMKTPLFNNRSSYLVTGGLSGIGFEVAKWMVEQGAKYILLASRNPPKPEIAVEIQTINKSKGARLTAIKADVSCYDDCRRILEEIIPEMGLPPLKGVMHSAGTLADGFVINQDWDRLSSTFKAKIDGTLNLHNVTSHLHLEHFVLFSSIVAQMGTPGQSNHAAGNQFEDSFAHYRNSIGLAATSINWGFWCQVGIATGVDFFGTNPITTRQGLAALDNILRTNRLHTLVSDIKNLHLIKQMLPRFYNSLDDKVTRMSETAGPLTTSVISSSQFWEQYTSKTEILEKASLIKLQVRGIVGQVLKLPPDDPALGDNASFESMGVDSLMFVELKNGIQSLFGNRGNVSESLLRDNNSVSMLSKTLISQIEGGAADVHPDTTSAEERMDLIREDCLLPETVAATDDSSPIPITQVKTVMLTGCSGILGSSILKELAQRSNVTRVICLMRRVKGRDVCEELLRMRMKEPGIMKRVDMEKVEVICGDVGLAKLGFDDATWDNLSNEVDAIFHCAAQVNHLERYKKSTNSKQDVRFVNIGGLKNILEFACAGNKLKNVFHASSFQSFLLDVGMAGLLEEGGHSSEKWPSLDSLLESSTSKGAYIMSKMCQELLLKQAVERGIPCKAFRFPVLSGPGVNVKKSHLLQRFLFCMEQGIFPNYQFPLMVISADKCASAAVELFFNEKCPNEPVNLTHPSPNLEQDFVQIAKKKWAKTLRPVDRFEFVKLMEQNVTTNKNSALVHFQEVYNEKGIVDGYIDNPLVKLWLQHHKNDIWKSGKISKYLPGFYDDLEDTMHYFCEDLYKAIKKP